MAKPPIPVGYVRAAYSGTIGPATWVNVFYISVVPADGATPGQVIADVVQWLRNFYNDGIGLGNLLVSWQTRYVTCVYRDAADSTVRLRVADALAGTNNDPPGAAQQAYLINYGTSDPRRGGKPRTYVAGVPDGKMQDSATLSSDALSSINDQLPLWLEANLDGSAVANGTATQLVEMSFVNGKVDRDAAVSYPILGATVNPITATQRRRVDRLRLS